MLSSSKLVIIIIFFAFLSSIFIGSLTKINAEKFAAVERREPFKYPILGKVTKKSLTAYCTNVELWVADKFFARQEYISAYQALSLTQPQSTTKDSIFVFGKEGWIFLGNQNSTVLDYTKNINIASNEAVQKKIDYIRKLQEQCAAYKIPFVSVIAPNKHTIYQEFLPAWLTIYNANERLADKVALEAKKLGLPLVFPRSLLEKAKEPNKQVYYKDDTHWNNYGAYLAFCELAAELQKQDKTLLPNLEHIKLKAFEKSNMGDLIILGHIAPTYLDKEGYQYLFDEKIPLPYSNKTLLLFGDSFSEAWMPLFEASFKTIKKIHSSETPANIEKLLKEFNPDVVIFEMVERDFVKRNL